MGRALLVSGFVLLCSTILAAQPKLPKQSLELTAEIVSQTYCAANQDTASLELKLKLRFRNLSNQKLIVYNGHDLFYQTKIRSAPGTPAGPYEVWVVNARYFDAEVEAIDQPSPGKVFHTIAPGAVYLKEISIGVPIVNEKIERGDSAIRNGDHTLQMIVSMWYKNRSLAQKLRQQWQRKGLLWSDPLVSPMIHFLAVPPDALAPCK